MMFSDQTFVVLAGGTVLVNALHTFFERLFYKLSDVQYSGLLGIITIFASLLLSGLELSLRRQFTRKGFLFDYFILAVMINAAEFFFSG